VYVTIQERPASLRTKYDIEAPSCNYFAQKNLFSFPARLQIFTEGRQPVATIVARWSLFREKYDFIFSDGRTYRFWCERVWKAVFACQNGQEKIEMYRHRGLKFSFFQNDVQIAAMEKNRIVMGRGNRYEIRMNSDANLLVIVCMALAVNTDGTSTRDATVTFDAGNIGPQARQFDESWRPS
jgi:hypothetical protein